MLPVKHEPQLHQTGGQILHPFCFQLERNYTVTNVTIHMAIISPLIVKIQKHE